MDCLTYRVCQLSLVGVLIVQGQMKKRRGGEIDTTGKVEGVVEIKKCSMWDKFTWLPLCLLSQVLLIAFSITIVLCLAVIGNVS